MSGIRNEASNLCDGQPFDPSIEAGATLVALVPDAYLDARCTPGQSAQDILKHAIRQQDLNALLSQERDEPAKIVQMAEPAAVAVSQAEELVRKTDFVAKLGQGVVMGDPDEPNIRAL